MNTQVRFYLSRVIGSPLIFSDGRRVGKVKDFAVSVVSADEKEERTRAMVSEIAAKTGEGTLYLPATNIQVEKNKSKYVFRCQGNHLNFTEESTGKILLCENVLDKQIVDINGRKLVRVNDVRLVCMDNMIYVVAVDTGMEGLLRRIGIVRPVNFILSLFRLSLPSEFILWDDIATVDLGHMGIRLSKTHNKLTRLHPSDLADIIEQLGNKSKTNVFVALDEEHAADVLEEMEQDEQVDIIEALPVEKAADVLEKMPADEAADIIEELEVDRAEKLLKEMEPAVSGEVRELLEYPSNRVGSLMTTDFLAFPAHYTVNEVLSVLRARKPEFHMMYSFLVTDKEGKFLSTVSLRDIVIAEPHQQLKDIMDKTPLYVYDDDKLDSLAEIIDKYSLLALPVINRENKPEGIVIVEDIVEDLLDKRKTE